MAGSELQLMGEKESAEYLPLVDQAKAAAAAIVDSNSFEAAALLYQDVKARIKRVGQVLDPFVKRSYDEWKKDVADRQKYLDPLEKAEATLKPAIAKYQADQEKKRQEEQRALEEANRKAAEDAQIAEAEAAAAAGNKDQAESILSAPVVVAPVVAPPSVPKVKGLGFRDNWNAQIVDIKALLKAVLEGKVPYAAIKADESWLNAQAKQLKAEMNYPGVKVLKNNIPVSR